MRRSLLFATILATACSQQHREDVDSGSSCELCDATVLVDAGEEDAGEEDACIPPPCPAPLPGCRYEGGGCSDCGELICGDSGALLAWQSPGGFAGWGPAMLLEGTGRLRLYSMSPGFDPELGSADPPDVDTMLSVEDTARLFELFSTISFDALPHDVVMGWDCYPELYVRECTDCPARRLMYDGPDELRPEMEPVWALLDEIVTVAPFTNPREYCAL